MFQHNSSQVTSGLSYLTTEAQSHQNSFVDFVIQVLNYTHFSSLLSWVKYFKDEYLNVATLSFRGMQNSYRALQNINNRQSALTHRDEGKIFMLWLNFCESVSGDSPQSCTILSSISFHLKTGVPLLINIWSYQFKRQTPVLGPDSEDTFTGFYFCVIFHLQRKYC